MTGPTRARLRPSISWVLSTLARARLPLSKTTSPDDRNDSALAAPWRGLPFRGKLHVAPIFSQNRDLRPDPQPDRLVGPRRPGQGGPGQGGPGGAPGHLDRRRDRKRCPPAAAKEKQRR